MPIELPEKYPLVIAAATSTVFLNVYQYLNVRNHRRASGIKYPQLYAEQAEVAKNPLALKFNCAQRAHQNTLESISYVLMMGFVTGLKYPVTSASLLTAWILGRVSYTYYYSKGDPTKRGFSLFNTALTGLMLTSVASAGQLVYELYK
ncbi:membrane-associated proteins in eicosanoid and glutathione metabolism [Dacryopinax primogenitus]|uniref:Membrane-associated proteins in eicosanoid and glutathione metabolism n=1 Tax=Dacryopinax primogenitus (strain DJM 731) TaxID=1858805 RepID=M5GCM3_DACPD|nr:membrane-associated proteins in eicosanoid and glutathione metabolism [Dacryopinax primogenitus]EJU06300.1 membrane-associated proteins in eicosanoid and glutathione metabolism [Dacryopinax primogenitus]